MNEITRFPLCLITAGLEGARDHEIQYQGPREHGLALCRRIRQRGGHATFRSMLDERSRRFCFLMDIHFPLVELQSLALESFANFHLREHLGGWTFRVSDADGRSWVDDWSAKGVLPGSEENA